MKVQNSLNNTDMYSGAQLLQLLVRHMQPYFFRAIKSTNILKAIAFYQADSVAETYTTLGYLVSIVSVLGMPIMPRAKFIQTLLLNILGICIGSVSAPSLS